MLTAENTVMAFLRTLCFGFLLAVTSTALQTKPLSRKVRVGSSAGSVTEYIFPRPQYNDYARMARWLAHTTSYGTLSTLDLRTGGPSGGIVSHSDSLGNNPTGRLFFYLSPLDESTTNLEADPRVAYTLSEAQLGTGCSEPEDPTCARITVLGLMELVQEDEEPAVRDALFVKHPEMATWPEDHHFAMYELVPNTIQLLDWYGGMHVLSADEYFRVLAMPKKLYASTIA